MTDNLSAASQGDMRDPRLAITSTNKHPYISDVGKGPKCIDNLLKRRQPSEWIVDLFGACGACVLLAGESGAGKTSFLYQMAKAISKGESFMGQLNTVKNKVLIVQADESVNNALDKLQLMGIDDGIDFFFGENGWNTLNIDRIRKEVKKGRYGVLFFRQYYNFTYQQRIFNARPRVCTPSLRTQCTS